MLLPQFFTEPKGTEVRSPMRIPSRFSAVAFAPLAIIVLVFMMVFSTHPIANANATPAAATTASPAASPDAAPDPQSQIISCSSDNMRRNYCAADVRGGVH